MHHRHVDFVCVEFERSMLKWVFLIHELGPSFHEIVILSLALGLEILIRGAKSFFGVALRYHWSRLKRQNVKLLGQKKENSLGV